MNLQAETPESLLARLPLLTLPEARKIVAAVHRDEGLSAIPQGVRRIAFDAVRREALLPALEVTSERRSALDPFRVYTLRSPEGGVIETVRIPLEKAGRFSVCVSSQVGCALGCGFCATGRLGLSRNLHVWEIVEQVRIVKRSLREDALSTTANALDGAVVAPNAVGKPAPPRVHGVVFQGMGEPMANLERVLRAIRVLTDPCALAIDARQITVTTAGLPAGILQLARDARNVRLGWSIFSARPKVREAHMPIARSHAIADVVAAGIEHAKRTNLAPMWAVTPLAGVNDTRADAEALGALFTHFFDATRIRPTLRLVPYNPIGDNDPFQRQVKEELERFRDDLRTAGIGAKLRYSGGSDVQAACGQLAAAGHDSPGKSVAKNQKSLPLVPNS
jgi:23S rRNA (adenine2503-C2)-methyltransferase